jgi:hypothetical protein
MFAVYPRGKENIIGGTVMNRSKFIVVSVMLVIVLSFFAMPVVFGQDTVVENFEGIDSAVQLDEDADACWDWGGVPTVRTLVPSVTNELGKALELQINYVTPGTLFTGRNFAAIDPAQYDKFAFWMKVECEDPTWFRDLRVRLHGLPGGLGGNLNFSILAEGIEFDKWQYVEVSISELAGALAEEAGGTLECVRFLIRMQGSAPSPVSIKVTIDDIKFISVSN